MIRKTALTLAVWFASGFAVSAWAGPVEMEGKIDKMMAKQEEILQKLDAITSELQVVKVRATQR